MLVLLRQVRDAVVLARAEHAIVAEEIARDNLRRLQWLAAVTLAICAVLVLTFQTPGAGDALQVQAWKHALFDLHLGMGGAALLLGGLSVWLRRRPGVSQRQMQALNLTALVLALTFAVLLTAVDQWITPNITPFLLTCTLVGMVLLHRPLTIAAVYLLALAALLLLMGQTQQDPQLLLSNRANALSAVALGWMVAMLSWRKTAQNLVLRRQLQQRQLELEARQRELQHLAAHDGLTGLLCRAEVERLCRMELLRALRHGLPLSVLVIDLDNFKHINDRWGHPAGDAVLVAVAGVLRGSVRVSDLVGRMGGEEFMVLLPHSDAAAALVLAEKLRRALAELAVPAGAEQLGITASIGVATVPQGVESHFDALYQRADRALYRAKAAGRDRVEAA